MLVLKVISRLTRHPRCERAACTKYYVDRKWSSPELSWLWHHPWLCSFKIINEKFLQFYLMCKVKQRRLPLPLRALHATPKYTEFPLKWYTVIHVPLSHRNYVHNTLLTKLSHVNEHLEDSGMTAQHPVRPTPMPPGNGRQHARVIMNQCIRNRTGLRITFSPKNTAAYLSTE